MLEAVAKMGYVGVEFAGYYNRSATELHELLQKYGLQCCGTHISLDTLKGDELKKTVEFNKTIGNQYLIVAWMPDTYAASLESIKETAKVFNDIAAQLKEQGMSVGYHAHGGDFRRSATSSPGICSSPTPMTTWSCKWTSATVSKRVVIRSPHSSDSRDGPAQSTSRNPAVPTRL